MEIVMQKKNEKDKILRNASRFRSIQFHVFSLIRKEEERTLLRFEAGSLVR